MSATDSKHLDDLVTGLAKKAHAASLTAATLSTETKHAVLQTLAEKLEQNVEMLLAENARDLRVGEAEGLSRALLDRLRFTKERIHQMALGVREIVQLPDPVGEQLEQIERPNGLDIRKVRVPIGVVGIIYESRPNVTIDCAALCLKSGNATILRGGREAFHSNTALAGLIQESLKAHGVDPSAVIFIPTTDRYALHVLLKLSDYVHCIIPRGGEGLIKMVAEEAHMPVIKHYKGVCCLYIDQAADRERAREITLNAKTQRPSVCNAIENLFIHKEVAERKVPNLCKALHQAGVELRVDAAAADILTRFGGVPFKPAIEEDFYEEYLDMIISVKVVEDLEAAIAAVNQYGSSHSDGIVTEDEQAAARFLQAVDSATVYWNASTRFTDGYEFGLGAEIGISTDKLHARGPMGLRELTTYKYLIYGSGQIR